MTVKKIKYVVTIFCPDEKGFYVLPEGSLLSLISDDRVTALVPVEIVFSYSDEDTRVEDN